MSEAYQSTIDAFKGANKFKKGGENYGPTINAFNSANNIQAPPVVAPQSVAPPTIVPDALPLQQLPQVNLPSNSIVEDPSVQTILPQTGHHPEVKSALPWTQPKPAVPSSIPFDLVSGTVQPEPILPEQKTFGTEDLVESMVSGTKATLGRFFNLGALKEKATRENSRLIHNRSGLTDPYSNMMMSMLPDPKISPEAEANSIKLENKMLETGSEYLDASAAEGRALTWEEWQGFGGFLDYATGVAGQAGPSMLVGMVTMGLASPLLLEAEVNDELRSIPDLPSEEQLRLVEAGGLIAGSLEIMGLGVIARGMPKGLLAKMGVEKISAEIEKMAGKSAARMFAKRAGSVGGRVVTGSIAEGITEGLQDEVTTIAGTEAGKIYSDEEIASRRLNSVMAGMTMGGAARPAIGALGDVSGVIQERSADREVGKRLNAMAEQLALKVGSRPDQQLMPEPVKIPPIFSEFEPEAVTSTEGGDLNPKGITKEEPPPLPEGDTEKIAPPKSMVTQLPEVTPGSQADSVSTPQTSVVSPTEVQESTEEAPDLETEWQDYKNAKGKTLAQTKKIGDTKRGDDTHPIVVRKNKDGIFRVAEFWGSELLNLSPSQLLKNNYGGDIDNVPGGLLNKFATEEEATEAAKTFLKDLPPDVPQDLPPDVAQKGQDGTVTDTNVAATEEVEPGVEVEDKPEAKPEVKVEVKAELPKVEVKEEVVVKEQPIQADPKATEGQPGFKRKAIPGTNTKVITPDSSMEAGTTFKMVELSELLQGEGEFQNRKNRQTSQQALDKIQERAVLFDPLQVTEPSRTSDSGPPVTLPSGVIISGNGRVLTIKELYENPEYEKQRDAYLETLFAKYKKPGLANPFAGIKQPVLVQVLNTAKLAKDDASRRKRIIKFVKASNISKADEMSTSEKAANDVKGTKKIISLFKGGEMTSLANSPFVQAFATENVPTSERGQFFTDDALSDSGRKRISNALLTTAFGYNKSIVNILESTSNDVKAVTGAMLDVSAKYAEMQAGIEKDIIPKDMDLTPYIIKALDKISTLRKEGVKPKWDFEQTDFLAERDEIRDILVRAFYHDDLKQARSTKYITNILNKTIDKILEQDYTKGLPGLEEAAKTTSATEILDTAIKETKQENERSKNVSKNQGELIPPDEAPGGVGQGSGRGRSTKSKSKPKKKFAWRFDAAKKEDGTGIDQWTNPEFNASAREQILFDLAHMAVMDDTMAESLSMEERIGVIKNLEPKQLDQLLRKMVKIKFGLKYVEKEAFGGGNEAALVDSINNMKNAYHNMQGMAAVLGLPLKALGLEGTLGLRSEGMGGRTRAAAFFQSSPINDPLGPPYITIKGRFNAFAHEWGHALDYFLLNKLGQDWSRGMSNRLRGKSILDEETGERIEPWQATDTAERIKYAFGDLLNAMFQEEGDTAAKILELEGKISRARTDESVKKLEKQLDDLYQGMSKKRISKSEYFLGAKNQLVLSKYYARPTEMLARAFEAYVSHRLTVQSEGRSSPGNEFIAKPEEAYALKSEDAIDNKLVQDFVNRYPKENERLLIFEKFSELFHALQENLLEGVAADPDKSPMVEWAPMFEQKQNNNPLSKAAWKEHDRNLRVTQRAFEKTQEQPTRHPHKGRAERWWIAMEDGIIHPWMGTKYGTLLSMIRRYKDKPRAHRAITEIFKKIGIEPGGELSTSNTFPEEVRREVRRLSYAFKTLVDRHDGFLFNKKEENDLRLLLTSDPKTISKAMKGEMSPKVLKLAGDLRNLLDKMWHDVKKAGVNIDYLESNAYLPRILDVAKVFADQKGFIQKGYNLYSEVIWIDQEGNFDGSEEQLLSVGSIANEKKFKISNGIKLVTPPHLEEIVRVFKNVKEKRKEIEKMKLEDADPESIEAAELSMAEYLAENQDVMEEGYQATRKDWSVYLAADWNHRIHQMAGEDPSASSPMANFTKKRVMPKEADSYMIDFYTDPIDAIGKYITGAVRKAAYTKRFGRHLIPQGKKRFAPTKQLQDRLDYLFREGMAGEVDPQDVQNMRSDINAILGLTPPTDMGLKKTLNTAHSYALMGMLTRAVLTSIPEPFVAGIKMRSSIKGLKVFGLTMQEALTYVSKDVEQTVQKRRQIANILGLLDDPSIGEMASNRAGGTMMDDPKNQGRMNLWFVRVGLQGLTNAQRRATMSVSFQYLKELGMQFLAPVGFSEKAVKDNKKEAELVLLDLGIPPDQMEDFSTYMNDITLVQGLPDPEVLMTQSGDLTTMSELLAVSSGRIVERSIQDPLIGNRPRYAEHPLGKFVYSIQSFNYSFMQNVITGEGKHIKRLFKEVGGKRASLRTAQLLGPIAQLYLAHALVSGFREFLMNRERWDEKVEEGNIGSHIAGMTVSRAGTFGAFDPLVNAYTGLRYQRDLSNFMIGAIGSWYTKPTEDIIKLFSGRTNSENTTATEERAIRAAYQLIIVPMMVFAISNPKFLSVLGPLAGPISGAIAMAGTSHTAKKAVSSKAIEFLYGSKGDMSRRKSLGRTARKTRSSR